jgi:hypothetical protein
MDTKSFFTMLLAQGKSAVRGSSVLTDQDELPLAAFRAACEFDEN